MTLIAVPLLWTRQFPRAQENTIKNLSGPYVRVLPSENRDH